MPKSLPLVLGSTYGRAAGMQDELWAGADSQEAQEKTGQDRQEA